VKRTGSTRTWHRHALLLVAVLLLLAACGSKATAQGAGPSATAAATGTPTPASHTAVGASLSQARSTARVNAYLAGMTLDEKLGQMFLIETLYTYYSPDVDNMVRNLHAGAMIIYYQNIDSASQLQTYISAAQAHASIPLMVSMDEEGGLVDRLDHFEPGRRSAAAIAATGDPHQAFLEGAKDAHDLQAVGVNTDLAPVVDVPTIPVTGEDPSRFFGRFGSNPEPTASSVDAYAGQFMQGLQQNGVIATLKHWPGIGGSFGDPHLLLPVISRSRSQLEATDFAAFKNLLALNPGMIMVTHVIVQSIDPKLPATLSPTLVHGILRGELGYDGVVMTDSLYMKGISDQWNLGEAAVLSVLAGDDMLEGAWDSASMTRMLSALKAAVAQGRISQARIDQSVRRILLLKQQYGLLPPLPLHGDVRGASASVAPVASLMADMPRAGTLLARIG
jgi:beta-N-acetylhexosaminidase